MMNNLEVFVIIPAYNESQTIHKVLESVQRFVDREHIIVIDDGSSDDTADKAAEAGVHVYQHSLNRGLGGALGTGLAAGLKHNADIIVSLDADEQHDPAEIATMIAPIERGEADVVIGSRFLENQNMPLIRKIYNWGANAITWFIFGLWTTDSQSGFRAFSKKAAKQIQIKTNRMEVSSEFIKEIKGNALRMTEVPITAIYTEYSMSKGQNLIEGIKTFVRLILLRFRK